MSVEDICRAVQSRWQALAHYVWPATPAERLQAELARRTEDLARRYRRLVRRRRRIDALRDALARHGREDTRRRLAEQEARYNKQRWAYLRQKELCLALARGQLVVCDDRAPDDR